MTLIAVKGDYYDAIQIAEKMQSLPGFAAEGGARNIARRDGMGTVMLDAAVKLGQIPKHYFQAVGSGTGGISAWEAGLRLREDGRFGSNLPRLHLAQNLPNAPIYNAWKGKEPEAMQRYVRRRSLQPKASLRDSRWRKRRSGRNEAKSTASQTKRQAKPSSSLRSRKRSTSSMRRQ